MCVVECGDHLRVSNDLAVNNEVRHELADKMPFVVNRILALLVQRVPAFGQFNDQRVFVELLVQARLKFVQHRHRCTDDVLGDLFVFHPMISTTDYADFTDFLSSSSSVLSVSSVVKVHSCSFVSVGGCIDLVAACRAVFFAVLRFLFLA